MPYIEDKNNLRKKMDQIVGWMKVWEVKPDGKLNYILYKFCKDTIEPSYNNYKNYCAELRQCATEIERRLLAPYEDKKIQENGDVLGKKDKVCKKCFHYHEHRCYNQYNNFNIVDKNFICNLFEKKIYK